MTTHENDTMHTCPDCHEQMLYWQADYHAQICRAGRIFNTARKAQGFTSQAHLDAFFLHYDHAQSCGICASLDGWALVDDGFQPILDECPEGKRLYLEYCAVRS